MKKLKEIVEGSSEAITLVTHNGQCHCDDVYSTALLMLLLKEMGRETKILRTRNPEDLKTIEGECIIFDVFDGFLDHHKIKEINGDRNHRRPLAALGKIWRWAKWEIFEFLKIDSLSWRSIDNKIIYLIDAADNNGGEVNSPMSTLIVHYREACETEEEAWELCLGKALEDWKYLLLTEQKITALRPKFDALPTKVIDGKVFKISLEHIPPVGDLTEIDGIIWKTDDGLKVRLLGSNRFADLSEIDEDDIIFRSSENWLAEFKKAENVLSLKIEDNKK